MIKSLGVVCYTANCTANTRLFHSLATSFRERERESIVPILSLLAATDGQTDGLAGIHCVSKKVAH